MRTSAGAGVSRREGRTLRLRGERAQMRGLGAVEPQRPGEPVDGGGRGPAAAPLLQPRVPVHPDAGGLRDLLAAQARRAAAAQGRPVLGGKAKAARLEEIAQSLGLLVAHGGIVQSWDHTGSSRAPTRSLASGESLKESP